MRKFRGFWGIIQRYCTSGSFYGRNGALERYFLLYNERYHIRMMILSGDTQYTGDFMSKFHWGKLFLYGGIDREENRKPRRARK